MNRFIKHTVVLTFLFLGLATLGATLPGGSGGVTIPKVSATDHLKSCPSGYTGDPTMVCCPPGQTVIGEDRKTCCPSSALRGVAAKDQPAACLYAKYINPVIRLLSALVAVAVTLGIIIGGIQVTTSAGDPQKSAIGKNHIRNALLGLLAYLLLYSFLRFIVPGANTGGI